MPFWVISDTELPSLVMGSCPNKPIITWKYKLFGQPDILSWKSTKYHSLVYLKHAENTHFRLQLGKTVQHKAYLTIKCLSISCHWTLEWKWKIEWLSGYRMAAMYPRGSVGDGAPWPCCRQRCDGSRLQAARAAVTRTQNAKSGFYQMHVTFTRLSSRKPDHWTICNL